MQTFSCIRIIYNPNSTGRGKAMATKLQRRLKKRYPADTVELIPTEYAGHAEELAYSLACDNRHPLVVSVSGDGGYHEVVNGAAKAMEEGKIIAVSLLPAGNANDHYHSVHKDDIYTAIKHETPRGIDLLKITVVHNNKITIRRAHSYIGLGLTPAVGRELTASKLNAFKEAWIVVKGLLQPHYIQIKRNGQQQSFDSITISNIERMAKMLILADSSQINDGLFEVNEVPHVSRLHLYNFLRRAVTHSIDDAQQMKRYVFTTVDSTDIQCDGEIIHVPSDARVTITINEQQLQSVY